jgi:hypothetical protein
MNRIENLLRDATRDTAARVTSDSIPPLDLTRAHAKLPPPRRRWVLPVLGPVAAIAAVAVIVLAAVAQHPAGQTPALISGGAPPYYISLTADGPPPAHQPFANPPMDITVRSTRTSTVLATVKPPAPYRTFTLVGGTADDTTFLAGAQVQSFMSPMEFYLLRFQAGTRRVTLTPLHVRPSLTTALDTASLSPDGRYLALASDTRLTIQDLRTGTVRSWTSHLQGGYITLDRNDALELSWTAGDRGVSFIWTDDISSLLLLNPASSGDLVKTSKLLVPDLSFTGKGFACSSDPFVAAGGTVVLCGGYTTDKGTGNYPTGQVTTGFGEFSASTGKLLTILDPKKEHLPTTIVEQQFPKPHRARVVDTSKLPYLYWASPDGSILIGERDGKAFIFDDGQEQAIGWSTSIATPAGMNGAAVAW